MFRKQNPPSSSRKTNLSQFGLLDIPGLDEGEDDAMGLSDDDMDLEAELAAISGEGSKKLGGRAKVTAGNFDAMVASSLRDVPSDDEADVDENDPDLLSELHELTLEDSDAPPPPPRKASRTAPPPPAGGQSGPAGGQGAPGGMVGLLQERIENYHLAEANAKAKGESSRARRFSRGLKTLNELLKKAKAGRVINEEDIPPPVSTGQKTQEGNQEPTEPSLPPSDPVDHHADAEPSGLPEPLVPSPASPAVQKVETPDEPSASTAGADEALDPSKQAGLLIILKRKEQFKAAALGAKHAGEKPLALELLKVVKQFDLVADAYRQGQEMDLDELPTPQSVVAAFKAPERAEDAVQGSEDAPSSPGDQPAGLVTATSVEEALRQRLAVYQEQEQKAREANNGPKQRRMARIVKQYSDAIQRHLAGKPIPVDELPAPPGFAPIPVGGPTAAAPAPAPAPPPAARARQLTRADKQLAYLLQRQKEFKEAALKAKRNGNIEQAKECLRAAKGFDAVLQAARAGLAVDLASLPLPPPDQTRLENTFDMVSADDCAPEVSEDQTLAEDSVLPRLHQQLTQQLKLCLATRDHYRAMGNVAEKNRFEHLAVSVKQDLDIVDLARRTNSDPPKFHYTNKQFSVVQCNTDLNENDLELTIVRGIAYNVPNPREIDTYVKFEFPYPQDAPVTERTHCVKDTNSPEYNTTHALALSRGARACLRVFKRHAVKFEVYSRGGWFARDHLLGAVSVRLAPLETTCTLHEAFPLMDGRRPAGGSLEVRLRVRTPLLQQQFDNTTHRWLTIDT